MMDGVVGERAEERVRKDLWETRKRRRRRRRRRRVIVGLFSVRYKHRGINGRSFVPKAST